MISDLSCEGKPECIEASNFDPTKAVDTRTIEPTRFQIELAKEVGQSYETTGDHENVGGMTDCDLGGVKITPNESAKTTTLRNGTLSTEFVPSGSETAVLHSHPNGNSVSGIGSGPGDDQVVTQLGVPNFTVFEGQTGVTGMVNGQFFFQSIKVGLGR